MVLFLALGMRLRPWVTTAAVGGLFIGLMSFGGRGALFTIVLLIAAAALFQLSAGLVTRRLSVGFLVAFVAVSLLLPILFVALTTMTDIGRRILTHLYFDDSAEVRVIQWRILDLLKWQDVLFGISPDRIEFLKAQIGLLKPGMNTENFWLLMFLNLGTIGFPFFAGALFLLLLHQGVVDQHGDWLDDCDGDAAYMLDEQLARPEVSRPGFPRSGHDSIEHDQPTISSRGQAWH